jgi:hypothetical protein
MRRTTKADSSSDNMLIRPLGPTLELREAMMRMTERPDVPREVASMSRPLRIHHVLKLRDLHIPSEEEGRLQRTIDILARQALVNRDPKVARSWILISGEDEREDSDADKKTLVMPARPLSKAMAAATTGCAGSGKTISIHRSFLCFPGQVIRHPNFPKLIGAHYQVVWISIDAPGSGRAEALAEALMIEWDTVMDDAIDDYERHFDATLAKATRDGAKMLTEWRKHASSHFLAVLHIDEVQNLFKLLTLKQRRKKKSGRGADQALSIADDRVLKWLLSLINRWGISVVFSGTPDGIGALTSRLATSQRLAVGGYHHITPFPDPADGAFQQFIRVLSQYQWTIGKLRAEELFEPIFRLTAGVRRLIIALWIAAHRVAFERKDDELRVSDFERAASTLLAPTKPGVQALLSRSPDRFDLFEDLKPGEQFWETFWSDMGLGAAA